MDSEASLHSAKRRAEKIVKLGGALVLAGAFVASIKLARSILEASGPGAPVAILAIILPILILTLWWVHIIRTIRRMDELERAIEAQSLAMACAATVWITTVWGLLQLFLAAPELPLVMVAPLAAVIYGVIRVFVGVRYR